MVIFSSQNERSTHAAATHRPLHPLLPSPCAGRELIQSRGRARRRGACFVHIIAEGSAEREAASMRRAQLQEECMSKAQAEMAM